MALKKSKPVATKTKAAAKKTKPALEKSKPAAKKVKPAKTTSKTTTKSTSAKATEVKKSKLVEIQTKQTSASVVDFINAVPDEQKRKDSFVILEMMKKASGEEPKMWGGSLIGFGNKRYKSPNTGREVDWLLIGFSPRKANLSLYLTMDIKGQQADALKKLGKHKTGVGCLYINKLEDIDVKILKGMIDASLKRK